MAKTLTNLSTEVEITFECADFLHVDRIIDNAGGESRHAALLKNFSIAREEKSCFDSRAESVSDKITADEAILIKIISDGGFTLHERDLGNLIKAMENNYNKLTSKALSSIKALVNDLSENKKVVYS